MRFDLSQLAAISPLSIVMVAGLAVLLLEAFAGGKGRRYLMGFTIMAAVVAFGAEYLAWGEVAAGASRPVFSGALDMDRFSILLGMTFLVNAVLVALLAPDFLREHGFEFGEFYALLLFGTAGMMIMAAATDFVSIFIGIETMSLAVYVLTGSWRKSAKSSEGAMKYFIVGSFATAVLLYGMALVYGATGSLKLSVIAATTLGPSTPMLPIFIIGMLLIVAALAFKIAAVPFHMWAPDAYEGAPTPVTAFMAAGVKAAGFAAILRLFGTAFSKTDLAYGASGWSQIFAILAIATMTLGNLSALRQDNVKRMLAYSSIAHAGYLLLGVVVSASVGANARSAVVFYLITYVFTTIGAFGVLAWLSSKNDERLQLDGWAGLASRYPGAAIAMTIFMLSLAGIPPTGGFFGKFYLFRAVLERSDLTFLVVIAVINSVISAYYYLRVITAMYFREVGREPHPIKSAPMGWAIALCALGTLGLGLLPGWLLTAAQNAPLGK